MMSILRRATEQQQSDWRPVPEGLWRWVVGVPELKLSEKFGNYQVRFPLSLTSDEKDRLKTEAGDPPEGIQQSWRTAYTVGLSLGYVQRDGQYKTTKLIDFLAACMGQSNTKGFRKWVADGGGPPRPADKDDQKAELDCIGEWLKWWENLEVYGAVRHTAAESGVTYANFAGPMPVGSLPGQRDDDYQALGRGKLRAMLAETDMANDLVEKSAVAVAAAPKRTYDEIFGKEDEPGDGSEDRPF